ncbi:hypothetical protein D3C87_419660 [compost metagenome]
MNTIKLLGAITMCLTFVTLGFYLYNHEDTLSTVTGIATIVFFATFALIGIAGLLKKALNNL